MDSRTLGVLDRTLGWHLLDLASSDIRFVVQIETDVGHCSALPISASICSTDRMSDLALSNKCIMLCDLNLFRSELPLQANVSDVTWQRFAFFGIYCK